MGIAVVRLWDDHLSVLDKRWRTYWRLNMASKIESVACAWCDWWLDKRTCHKQMTHCFRANGSSTVTMDLKPWTSLPHTLQANWLFIHFTNIFRHRSYSQNSAKHRSERLHIGFRVFSFCSSCLVWLCLQKYVIKCSETFYPCNNAMVWIGTSRTPTLYSFWQVFNITIILHERCSIVLKVNCVRSNSVHQIRVILCQIPNLDDIQHRSCGWKKGWCTKVSGKRIICFDTSIFSRTM